VQRVHCAGCPMFPFQSLRCSARFGLHSACFAGGIDYSHIVDLDWAVLERKLFDWGGREAAASAGGPIGLRQHERHARARGDDRTQRRNGESRSAGERYPGFGMLSLHRAAALVRSRARTSARARPQYRSRHASLS